MGAWGHGVYESDTSLDTVNFIFETIGVINDNGNILLESGDVIPAMMWNPGYGKLHSSIVKNMINNFKVLEEDVLSDPDESFQADKYLVLCSMIINNGEKIPKEFLDRCIQNIEVLNKDGGHTSLYDNPMKRKAQIDKVLSPLLAQKLELELPKDEEKKTNRPKI